MRGALRHAVLAMALGGTAWAQPDPRLMLLVDTSGSMNWDMCGERKGGLDDSAECPGSDVPCTTCNADGCDNGLADDSRMWKVKSVLRRIPGACDDRQFALARFSQNPIPFVCGTSVFSSSNGGWEGTCSGANILVPFAADNQSDLLEWLDLCDNYGTCAPSPESDAPDTGCSLCAHCGTGCDKELRAHGPTPLARSLLTVHHHLTRYVLPDDPHSASRPYTVVLLTDGRESCGGDPAAAAAALCDVGVSVVPIGFTVECGEDCFLEDIAAAGCQSACEHTGCSGEAILAEDEQELERALLGVCAQLADGGVPVDAGTPLSCEPHTQGFWKRQCAGPHPSGEHERLADYVDPFNDALTFADDADVDALCGRLRPDPESDKCEQAEAQLAALLLNVASQRLDRDCCVSSEVTPATTAGDASSEVDQLLASADRTFEDCVRAQEIAASINEARTLCEASVGASGVAVDAGAHPDAPVDQGIRGKTGFGVASGPTQKPRVAAGLQASPAPNDGGPAHAPPSYVTDTHGRGGGCQVGSGSSTGNWVTWLLSWVAIGCGRRRRR